MDSDGVMWFFSDLGSIALSYNHKRYHCDDT